MNRAEQKASGAGEGLEGLPKAYVAWRASPLGRVTDASERDVLLNLLGRVAGLDVLDVGCGDGALAVELRQRGAAVTGIDSSSQMIAAARERAAREGAEMAFNVALAESLPFPPEHFDRVLAVTVLCFVEDAAPVLREMVRVLRPGGRLVVGELGRWNAWALERRFRGWLGSPVWRRAYFRSARELRALVSAAGLAPEPVRGAIYYPPCGVTARLMAPCDRTFSRLTTVGAAFLALSATKPLESGDKLREISTRGR